jgi:hypothetical protein
MQQDFSVGAKEVPKTFGPWLLRKNISGLSQLDFFLSLTIG